MFASFFPKKYLLQQQKRRVFCLGSSKHPSPLRRGRLAVTLVSPLHRFDGGGLGLRSFSFPRIGGGSGEPSEPIGALVANVTFLRQKCAYVQSAPSTASRSPFPAAAGQACSYARFIAPPLRRGRLGLRKWRSNRGNYAEFPQYICPSSSVQAISPSKIISAIARSTTSHTPAKSLRIC